MSTRETNHTKLIKEARGRTALKGRTLGEFFLARIETGHPPVASRGAMTAICEKCGASAGIDPASPSGVSQIWGEALEKDCPGRVLRDEAEGSEEIGENQQLLESVAEKLHPRRFPRMTAKFAAVLGALLGEIWTEPALVELVITSDGFLLGRHEGEAACNEFLGPESWLKENLAKLLETQGVDLTGPEKEFVWEAYGRIGRVQEPAPG
ncbi:MAG: hypothetical protein FJ134_06340 [Deltaproteobacteria bacterium]|nr:hypothetical protein [Deltaproteobacteria bacterium]